MNRVNIIAKNLAPSIEFSFCLTQVKFRSADGIYESLWLGAQDIALKCMSSNYNYLDVEENRRKILQSKMPLTFSA